LSIIALSITNLRIMTLSVMAFYRMPPGIKTFCKMTLRVKTLNRMTDVRIMKSRIIIFNRMTLAITAFNIRTISVMAFDGVTFLRRITPHHYDIQQYGNQRYFKDWHSSRTTLTRIAFNITAFRMTFNRMLLSRTTPSILTFRNKALRIPVKDSEAELLSALIKTTRPRVILLSVIHLNVVAPSQAFTDFIFELDVLSFANEGSIKSLQVAIS
jgi:hypothetical protein